MHHVHGGRSAGGASPAPSPTGIDRARQASAAAARAVRAHRLAAIGPSETFDVEHECSARRLPAGRRRLPLPLPHRAPLLRRHVGHLAGVRHPAGRRGVDRRAAAAAAAAGPGRRRRARGARPTRSRPAGVGTAPPTRCRRPGCPKGYDASGVGLGRGGRAHRRRARDRRPRGRATARRRPGVRPPILFDPHRTAGLPDAAAPSRRPPAVRARTRPGRPHHRPRPDGLRRTTREPTGAVAVSGGHDLRTFSMRAMELPVPLNARLGPRRSGRDPVRPRRGRRGVQRRSGRRSPLAVRANAGEHCVDVRSPTRCPTTPTIRSARSARTSTSCSSTSRSVTGSTPGSTSSRRCGRSLSRAHRSPTPRPPARRASPSAMPIASAWARSSVSAWRRGRGSRSDASTPSKREARSCSTAPLERPHPAGATVSTEFVRHRWYPDVQVGTAYFHDHVNGIRTWQHGLVGAVVVEPPGATYHDPTTGAEVSSGALVDVHVDGDTPVSADISGSFREFVAFIQEPSRLTNVDRSPGTNLNLRAEPLDRRDGPAEQLFSSTVHGDPATPLVRAYVGDPVVVRATVGGTNEVHTWHLDGHWFRDEPWSQHSRPTFTTHLGISERKDMSILAAGGPQQRAGDYLYSDGRALKLQEGAWGLLRVLEGSSDDSLTALPGHDPPIDPPPPICPLSAPRRTYAVTAVELPLPMLGAEPGLAFVEASQLDAVRSERARRPLSYCALRWATASRSRWTTSSRQVRRRSHCTPTGWHTTPQSRAASKLGTTPHRRSPSGHVGPSRSSPTPSTGRARRCCGTAATSHTPGHTACTGPSRSPRHGRRRRPGVMVDRRAHARR